MLDHVPLWGPERWIHRLGALYYLPIQKTLHNGHILTPRWRLDRLLHPRIFSLAADYHVPSDAQHTPDSTPQPCSTTVIDPVCGMSSSPALLPGRSHFDGTCITFASRHCVQKFSSDPKH